MDLSSSELKLVEGIDQIRRRKIMSLVAVAIVAVIYWILRYADVLESFDVPFDALIIFYFGYLASDAVAHLRSGTRYMELLRRYANNDPDTLLALSESSRSRQEGP